MFGKSTVLEVVDPHRPAPRSIYVLDDPALSGRDKDLVAYLLQQWRSRSDTAAEFRRRLVAGMNQLGAMKHFVVKEGPVKRASSLVEIVVAPTNRRQTVSIAEAGFGLSQVLPLLVQDARLSAGYLIAYQPELHLHPFAQSRLADVFADSVRRGNQLFIETHSVDLVMGVQRAVAEGRIDNDSVRIFFVENVSGKASVQSVPLDELGGPRLPFPKGSLSWFQTAKAISRARYERQVRAHSTASKRKVPSKKADHNLQCATTT